MIVIYTSEMSSRRRGILYWFALRMFTFYPNLLIAEYIVVYYSFIRLSLIDSHNAMVILWDIKLVFFCVVSFDRRRSYGGHSPITDFIIPLATPSTPNPSRLTGFSFSAVPKLQNLETHFSSLSGENEFFSEVFGVLW